MEDNKHSGEARIKEIRLKIKKKTLCTIIKTENQILNLQIYILGFLLIPICCLLHELNYFCSIIERMQNYYFFEFF